MRKMVQEQDIRSTMMTRAAAAGITLLLAFSGRSVAQTAVAPLTPMQQNYPNATPHAALTPAIVAGCPGSAPNGTPMVVPCEPNTFTGAVALTPGGAAVPAGRAFLYITTAAGVVTLTLADGSTLALPLGVTSNPTVLGLSVTGIALSGGAAGNFWTLK